MNVGGSPILSESELNRSNRMPLGLYEEICKNVLEMNIRFP